MSSIQHSARARARRGGSDTSQLAVAGSQLSFDYGDMPPSDSKALERHAENVLRIQERQRKTTAENVLKLGEELKAAQERLSVHRHGTFKKWVSQRCGISFRTACYAMNSYQVFGGGNGEKFAPLFDASAMYLLSADTCPEDALNEAIEIAKSGGNVTHKTAKELIAKHTVDADSVQESDEQDGDESPAFVDTFSRDVWNPAFFVTDTRKYLRTWLQKCPPSDLHYICDALRDLAAQIERNKNDSSDA